MARNKVRYHLMVGQTLGPYVIGGFGFTIIGLILWLLVDGELGVRGLVLGLAVHGMLTLVGIAKTCIMWWQTRGLDD